MYGYKSGSGLGIEINLCVYMLVRIRKCISNLFDDTCNSQVPGTWLLVSNMNMYYVQFGEFKEAKFSELGYRMVKLRHSNKILCIRNPGSQNLYYSNWFLYQMNL